jgi:hypothetical protein
MKKTLILTIAVLFVMLPFASFAKTVISDSDLEEVTAEEGVSVNFSNFSVRGTATVGTTSWGDSDGYPTATYNSPGYAGANGVALSGNITFNATPMNVDVGTSGSSTRVNLTLPTTSLGSVNVDSTMKLSSAMDLSGGKEMGRMNMQGFSTQATVDRVQVFAH